MSTDLGPCDGNLGMGTGIEAKTYFSGSYSGMDLNDGVCSSTWVLYHEPKHSSNDQYYNSFFARPTLDGYLVCDKEQLRQTILKHQSLFRYQLEELHRLYKIQRDLVNEIKRRELQQHLIEAEGSQCNPFLSHIPCVDVEKRCHVSDLRLVDPTFGRPTTSGTNGIWSPLSFMGGKNMFGPFPTQDRVESKNEESREAKRNMLQRTLLNLEIPASECMNEEGKKVGESESFLVSRTCKGTSDRDVNLCLGSVLSPIVNGNDFGPNSYAKGHRHMVDLNEPTQVEEASISASVEDNDSVTCLDEEIRRQVVSANSKSGFHILSKESCQSFLQGREGRIRRNNMHSDNEGNRFTCMNQAGQGRWDADSLCRGGRPEDPPALFTSSQVERSNEHRRKRTIFGVEISEGNHGQSVEASHTPNISPPTIAASIFSQDLVSVRENASVVTSFPSNVTYSSPMVRREFQNKENIESVNDHSKHDNPMGRVSWLEEKELAKNEPIKCKEDSQPTNSHCSLNHPHQFVDKAEMLKDPSRISIQDSQSSISACDTELERNEGVCHCDSKILGFPISVPPTSPWNSSCVSDSERKVKDLVTEEGMDNYISGLRHHIDLNLCVSEDEAPTVPSIPRAIVKIATTEIDLVPTVPSIPIAIVKIATTEIDLDSPAVFEFEACPFPQTDSCRLPLDEDKEKDEELVRVAAEAITAISSSDPMEYIGCHTSVFCCDSLLWLAEVVSSYKGYIEGGLNDEDSIPDGMDYFEFTTLKLTETKVEEYFTKSPTFEIQETEEMEPTVLSKRPRRGQARRGRQQKDFQRDVLPGLVTLSRHEVTEDFVSFEMLFKGSSLTLRSRKNTAKKGRGRRRLGDSVPTLTPAVVCSPTVEQPFYREFVLEGRTMTTTLTGWGKRTRRRLPRLRCPAVDHR